MLKGAIVGFGFISSKGHLPAYLERKDVRIEAVADVCEARRELARKLVPDARIYATHGELLAAEEGLDFLDIATPPVDHAAIALDALDAGLHVLCEKPLTCTLKEALDLVEAARDQRRVVFPAHNYKHAPVVKFAARVIDSGSIGAVRAVTLNTFRTTHAKGVPEWR